MAFYSEKDYLSSDNENDIEQLDEYRYGIKETAKKELLDNYDLIEKYYEYINMISSFLNGLHLESSLEYALAIRHMIFNGILSYNNKFNSKIYKFDKELYSKSGINIINGEGCCRNVADLYYDIMNSLDMYCKKYYCFQSCIKFKPLVNKSQANHLANIIMYNDNLYVMDLYNNNLCKFISSNIAKVISFGTKEFLIYKPYCEYIFEDKELKDIKENILLFESASNKISLNEYNWSHDLRQHINRIIASKDIFFREFGNDTSNIKNEIKLCLTK